MLSPLELTIVGLLVVLLFGTKRLPELGSGLGKAISNFKRSYRETSEIDVTPASKVGEAAEPPPKGEKS
jgi:sec-independent protein translocase protein TatA